MDVGHGSALPNGSPILVREPWRRSRSPARHLRHRREPIEHGSVSTLPGCSQIADERLIDLELTARRTAHGAGLLLTLGVAQLLDMAYALAQRTHPQRAAKLAPHVAPHAAGIVGVADGNLYHGAGLRTNVERG
jgi:hypothetical protein